MDDSAWSMAKLVDRKGWGAIPATSIELLNHPAYHVLFYHFTDVEQCMNREECSRSLLKLQRQHMEQGMPDIAFNFMVSGDGTMYEGRGWDYNPTKLFDIHKEWEGRSIDIAYIGDYISSKKPSVPMARAIMPYEAHKADNIRVNLVDRPGWGAAPPTTTAPLVHPTNTVLFYHNSDINPCHSHVECVKTVRELQKRHMDQGLPDIAYNFVIGGDGTVYEGRGWHINPSKLDEKHSHLEGRSLDIAFIGRFNYAEKLAYPDMAQAGVNLLNIAVHSGFCPGTFKFVEVDGEDPSIYANYVDIENDV